jgi:cytochrome P450
MDSSVPETKANSLIDPRSCLFGYGRRLCPGVHLAQSSAWIAMVSILAAFNISKKRDDEGNEICVNAEFGSGFIR